MDTQKLKKFVFKGVTITVMLGGILLLFVFGVFCVILGMGIINLTMTLVAFDNFFVESPFNQTTLTLLKTGYQETVYNLIFVIAFGFGCMFGSLFLCFLLLWSLDVFKPRFLPDGAVLLNERNKVNSSDFTLWDREDPIILDDDESNE